MICCSTFSGWMQFCNVAQSFFCLPYLTIFLPFPLLYACFHPFCLCSLNFLIQLVFHCTNNDYLPYCHRSIVCWLPNKICRSFAYFHVSCLYAHVTPNSIPETSSQVHIMLSFHDWFQDTIWKSLHCLHICIYATPCLA